jgi:ABC-type multidrug transport system, ATPase component
MSIIDISNVTKRYDDKLAVDSVSLKIEKGDIFGLLGPNGAGKSTLISIITGLCTAEGGEVSVDGYSVKKQPELSKKDIGLVPQEIALYENLSAYDNLQFWGALYGLKGKLLKSRIDEALETSQLKDRAKEKISSYSGGMKRRINIACAIMHHPKILIMDEPTVGIDPQSRNHVLEFARNMNRESNTTIIYTSHYMEEVETLCNKLAIMDQGKIIANGTLDEVKRMVSSQEKIEISVSNCTGDVVLKLRRIPGIRQADLNKSILTLMIENSKTILQKIIELLFDNNVKITDLSIKAPNLESVFLNLTGKSLRE